MSDLVDPKLMKMGDEAFWVEFHEKRSGEWDATPKRYVLMDGSKTVKVVITDANIQSEKKIEV